MPHGGSGVILHEETVIGSNCRIQANAVVTHDIPAYSTAVGVPAKIIKIQGKMTGNK